MSGISISLVSYKPLINQGMLKAILLPHSGTKSAVTRIKAGAETFGFGGPGDFMGLARYDGSGLALIAQSSALGLFA